jgi:predicted secreted acid phosphatase
MINKKTIFCDIDGTIFKQVPYNLINEIEYTILPGVKEKFEEWVNLKYIIILVSGREESKRDITLKQLDNAGIKYNQLILGIGSEDRFIINNNTKNEPDRNRAFAISLKRDEHFKFINFTKLGL